MQLAEINPETSNWTADQLTSLRSGAACAAPLLGGEDFAPVSPAICVWDAWPVQLRDGRLTQPNLWMALASKWFEDPEARHAEARIHLLECRDDGWRDLGPVLPDGFSPGSREWSGSAYLENDGSTLTLYFTAAGRRGETTLSFLQRLYEVQMTLRFEEGRPQLSDWRNQRELIARDPQHYMDSEAGSGTIGTIKAFRDPGYFQDPKTGQHWLFFTASLARTGSPFNGAIGAAVARGDRLGDWEVLPPLISAEGVNNELERPHVIAHGGLYYLFWSTQSHVFNPDGPGGPTGLYGMVSDRLSSGWAPLNGSGLVIANPADAPRQAYSWLVLPDLSVTSFVDDWGRPAAAEGAKRFGGSFAPFLRIALDGANTSLLR
ncbi:MAG: glycoside hydrolase family 68 protein [Sphingomonas sp.]|nr:glycoside hydrolase family 68 protein [Sphingomonas sp.]